MQEVKVKFEHPTWWLFIMAFRYAIYRPRTIQDVAYELLENVNIHDKAQAECMLKQMIDDTENAVLQDTMSKSNATFAHTLALLDSDIEFKEEFLKKVKAKYKEVLYDRHTEVHSNKGDNSNTAGDAGIHGGDGSSTHQAE